VIPARGFVKLLRLRRSSGKRVPLPGPPHPLGSPLRTRDLGPTREALLHLLTVSRRGQSMPSRTEVLSNGSIRRQKALRMPGGFEPLHAIFPLARRPMRVLTPIIEIAALAMLHPWQYLTLRRTVALQRPRSRRRPPYTFLAYTTALRGGLEGAGGSSAAPSIAANIERGFGLDHSVCHPTPFKPIPKARRGGLRGAGGISTDSSIAANIERGFCPKNRSAAVVPSG
jgi:hypothetical protein